MAVKFNMISKETFINVMERLEILDKKMDAVDTALKELSPDFGGFYIPDTLDIVVEILKDVFNDEDEWISYFIYERDWLHDLELDDVIMDGEPVDLSTWDKVYKFLIKNKNENENN